MPTESRAIVSTASAREAHIDQIMQVLTRPDSQMHLRVLGITPHEVRAQLASLDDAQLTAVAERAESVHGAGDAIVVIGISLGTILIVALIAFIVYVIAKDSKKL
jgi:hypothetical protein